MSDRTSADDTDVDDGIEEGFEKSSKSAKRAISEVKATVWHAIVGVQQWVQRRGKLTQIAIGGLIGAGIQEMLRLSGQLLSAALSSVPRASTFTEAQLLIALIGVGIGQTLVQTYSLNRLHIKWQDMANDATPKTDGGKEMPPRDETDQFTEEIGTSGGGALGGLIAGATLGSSFGPSSAVGGAVFGAVVGDVLEQWALGI